MFDTSLHPCTFEDKDINFIILGMQESSRKYKETSSILQNNQLLNEWHWSETHGAYLDFGLHSEDVVLQRPKLQNRHQNIPQQVNKIVEFYGTKANVTFKIKVRLGKIPQVKLYT